MIVKISSFDEFIVQIEKDPVHSTVTETQSLALERNRIPKVSHNTPRNQGFLPIFSTSSVVPGPYHHGKLKYQRKETVKKQIVSTFCRRKKAPVRYIYNKIRNMIEELRDYYEEHPTKGFDNEELAFMILLDGAFLIAFDYSPALILDWDSTYQDLFLLENQIPLPVLNVILDSVDMIHEHYFVITLPLIIRRVPFSSLATKSCAVYYLLHKVELMLSSKDSEMARGGKPLRNNVKKIVAKGIHLKPGKLWKFGKANFRTSCIKES